MSVRPHPKQGEDPDYADAWIVDYYEDGRGGKRKQVVYTGTKEDADQYELDCRIATKNYKPSVHPRIASAAPHFVKWYSLDHKPSGVKRTRQSINILLRYWGKYLFPAVTPPRVEEYKRLRLSEGVKPVTINKELSALSKMCKWAKRQGYCQSVEIDRFPDKMTKAPPWDVPSRAEVLRLLRATPRAKRGLLAAMYYAGLRSEEARTLTAFQVNMDMQILLITGKGDKQRVVPIIGQLKPYLRSAIKRGTTPLWITSKGKMFTDMRPTIKWSSKRAGITKHITPHLLRHAFGTHATMAGVGLRQLQDVMGHSTPVMTERYTQLAATHLIEEMKKF